MVPFGILVNVDNIFDFKDYERICHLLSRKGMSIVVLNISSNEHLNKLKRIIEIHNNNKVTTDLLLNNIKIEECDIEFGMIDAIFENNIGESHSIRKICKYYGVSLKKYETLISYQKKDILGTLNGNVLYYKGKAYAL